MCSRFCCTPSLAVYNCYNVHICFELACGLCVFVCMCFFFFVGIMGSLFSVTPPHLWHMSYLIEIFPRAARNKRYENTEWNFMSTWMLHVTRSKINATLIKICPINLIFSLLNESCHHDRVCPQFADGGDVDQIWRLTAAISNKTGYIYVRGIT